jgi:hypothetical protein
LDLSQISLVVSGGYFSCCSIGIVTRLRVGLVVPEQHNSSKPP